MSKPKSLGQIAFEACHEHLKRTPEDPCFGDDRYNQYEWDNYPEGLREIYHKCGKAVAREVRRRQVRRKRK